MASPVGGSGVARDVAINPWLIAIAVMSGTFMEVLDTTVVNVALPHIAGSLAATPEESTWALTSYLVANAIVLPMTGWLANHFGRKRILLFSVVGFTVASFLCGFAPNLPFLIICRIIQGATGGGLQPLSQSIMLEAFPAKDRGKAMAFWALGIVVAPMLGPVFGGWLTDNYSWRWIFYINIPVGILAIVMTKLYIFDPPYIRRKSEKVDYWGMGLLVVGIGALQIVLDKGQQEDWFESHFILVMAVICVVGLVGLIVRELTSDHPIIDLRIFRYRTYSTGVFLMTVVGFALYGSTVLLPLQMQTLLGYPAVDAGIATLPRGAASFLFMPIVGMIVGRADPRRLLAVGMIVSGWSMFGLSNLNLQAGFTDFFWPLVFQGAALGMLFIPLTTVTNDPVPKEEMGNATSIFNLMRNIGGSIGIAITTTLLARQQQVHTNVLGAHVNVYDSNSQSMLQKLTAFFISRGSDPATAATQAHSAIWGMVQQQAAMMSYNDVFEVLGWMFFLLLPLVFLMKRPTHQTGGVMMH